MSYTKLTGSIAELRKDGSKDGPLNDGTLRGVETDGRGPQDGRPWAGSPTATVHSLASAEFEPDLSIQGSAPADTLERLNDEVRTFKAGGDGHSAMGSSGATQASSDGNGTRTD
jgi:hypothetical protein